MNELKDGDRVTTDYGSGYVRSASPPLYLVRITKLAGMDFHGDVLINAEREFIGKLGILRQMVDEETEHDV